MLKFSGFSYAAEVRKRKAHLVCSAHAALQVLLCLNLIKAGLLHFAEQACADLRAE